MGWTVIPVNKRILLEKVELDLSVAEIGKFNFIMPDEPGAKKYEFFKVLDIDVACDKMWGKLEKGDLVVSENAMPIGKFGTKEYFLSPENAITAIIKENND
jgi:hypothetical protein